MSDGLLESLEQAIQEHPTVYESDRTRKSLLVLAAARIRTTPPPDTSLLRAYAECEEAWQSDAPDVEAVFAKHGWERKEMHFAYLEKLRRSALSAPIAGVKTTHPPDADIQRQAWDAGFALARSYGDNWMHCVGEQREKRWQEYLRRRALAGETK